jgi:2-polyprenyl-3-methyl-5-hydroxy-6-metoxy-1,4-benzoquinol methylase
MDYSKTNFGWQSPEPNFSHAYILPAVLALLPKGKKLNILDAGCGNGYIANQLAELGHTVTGVDQAEDGIAIAQKAYPRVRFMLGSVYDDLSSIVQDVDVIISCEVIEHLYYPNTFLVNMHRYIRPNGYIILTTPYHGYLKNLALSLFNAWDKHHTVGREGGHIKFFSEKTLSLMLNQSGYDDITYKNAGRLPFLWKSMVCRARKHA